MRFLAAALLLVQGTGFAPFDVASLAVAPPLTLAQVERRALHGEPSRLAWSADGTRLYLQSRDGLGRAVRYRHFQMRLGETAFTPLDEEPGWAAEYWHSKVTEAAPGLPALKIEVSVDTHRTRVAPIAGGFASAATGTGSDAASTVTLAYVTLSFLGVEIGRWATDEAKSGVTFGWGPAGSGAVAFVDRQGRLTLIDKERRVRPVARTTHVLLPAWSPDGNYVAYLEQQGRSGYRLASVALLRTDTVLQ
jgi:hypothetical protein